MRVGVDGRSLADRGPRGVAHYTSALLSALAACFPDDEWRVLLPRGAGRQVGDGWRDPRPRGAGRQVGDGWRDPRPRGAGRQVGDGWRDPRPRGAGRQVGDGWREPRPREDGGGSHDGWHVVTPRAAARGGVTTVRSALPARLLFGAAAVCGRPRLERLLAGCDVVWAPAPAPLAIGDGVPFVLTVHDRSWEQRPRDFTPYERAWHALARSRRLARRADRVLCDTEAVRADLVAAWGLDPARVTAVPLAPAPGPAGDPARGSVNAHAPEPPSGASNAHAPGPTGGASDAHAPGPTGGPSDAHTPEPTGGPSLFRATVPPPAAANRAAGGARPYLLFVGALEPRKAPDLLAAAYALARGRSLDADLVVVGEGRLADRLDGAGVRRLGRVDDARLAELYAGALAVVLPSWGEGFGLTPVEGVARGAPAVVSDLPALRESLGDGGALYVPPGDADALARALCAVANDTALHARLLAAGQAAVATLSWERTARATRAVLAEAAAR